LNELQSYEAKLGFELSFAPPELSSALSVGALPFCKFNLMVVNIKRVVSCIEILQSFTVPNDAIQ
jgi:hypothetical protein